MSRDIAMWAAVFLISVAAPVILKLVAAHTPWKSFQTFAAAS